MTTLKKSIIIILIILAAVLIIGAILLFPFYITFPLSALYPPTSPYILAPNNPSPSPSPTPSPSPSPTNRPPFRVACAAEVNPVLVGSPADFNAVISDNTPNHFHTISEKYFWTGCDPTTDESGGTCTTTYSNPGTYTVEVTARIIYKDADGVQRYASVSGSCSVEVRASLSLKGRCITMPPAVSNRAVTANTTGDITVQIIAWGGGGDYIYQWPISIGISKISTHKYHPAHFGYHENAIFPYIGEIDVGVSSVDGSNIIVPCYLIFTPKDIYSPPH